MNNNIDEIRKQLKKELDRDRFEHTIGVMYTAECLAMAFGFDMEKAKLAGLLHDCAKCIPDNKKLRLCRKNGIQLSDSEKKNPVLLHAKLGAYIAKEEYHIDDSEILHAISVHTTGEPDMNILDKIIYISDYIEPNRCKAKNLKEVRQMAFQDLNLTMRKILRDTLVYLEESNEKANIDPQTLKTYEFYNQEAINE